MFVDADEGDLIIPEVEQARAGLDVSLWDALRSGRDMEAIETDYYGRIERIERSAYRDEWDRLYDAVGRDYVENWLVERGYQRDIRPRGALFGITRDLAAGGDERFVGRPTNEVDFRDTVLRQINEEYLDAAANVQMGPRGSGVAAFAGRLPVAATDPTSLALMPLGGGGGSLLRVVAAEAALGAAGEAMILPRMYDVADQIDAVQDPDPVSQIAMGAVFGGAIGGGMHALGRGVSYLRLRNQNIPAPLMAPNHVAEQVIANAEEALATSRTDFDPFEGVSFEPRQQEAPAPEASAEDAAAAAAARRQAEAEARREYGSLTRPILTTLRRAGIQIDPTSPVADELRALGVTSRSAPGFYSRTNGTGALDNLVASEFPELEGLVRVGDMDGYFDLQDLLDALGEEVGGNPRLPMALRDVEAARAAEIDIERLAEGLGARLIDAPDRAETLAMREAYFPTPDQDRVAEGFLTDDELGSMLTRFERAQRSLGEARDLFGIDLSPEELDYAAGRLAETGGYVEDAIYDAIVRSERDLEAPNARGQESAEGGATPLPEDAFPTGRAGDAAGSPQGTAPQDGGAGGAVERTAAGEQRLIPGVEPVSQRQRLEAAQNAPMRGGDAPADMGLFDSGARLQRDMFDDPASPTATEFMDRLEAEFRADEAMMSMTMEDGMPSPRDLLDQIEADRRHQSAIEQCRIGGDA
jgi:hypothetical protein